MSGCVIFHQINLCFGKYHVYNIATHEDKRRLGFVFQSLT